ncbi:hypothetical protein VNI00_003190 [Paramarasmius palmivorus]|uniref:Uncharacterized protein n=1 Tax=Paramarasmius palmivorus TaxID=297713 RepID=A0AAW0DSU1_9AGAR
MSTDLENTYNAIATVSTGQQTNEDGWMTMWCSTNWGDLLQPAPLSIALLGSVIVIAAASDDFSLANADDSVQYQWKYITRPGSFKACLMQMVSDGYTAFGTAHNSMMRIQNLVGQLPEAIRTAVNTVVNGTPQEINAFLPGQIQSALTLVQTCATVAKEGEQGFSDICNLASELIVACTNQVGTTEQKAEAYNAQLQILEERRKSEEALVAAAKEITDMMKKSFADAESDFDNAVHHIPEGWDLVRMDAVDSLKHLAVSAGGALLSLAGIKGIAIKGREASSQNPGTSNKPPVQSAQATQDAIALITDPAAREAQRVLTLVNALKLLVVGGPNGGPDWDKIRGNASVQSDLLPALWFRADDVCLGKWKRTATTTITSIIQIAGTTQSADITVLDKFNTTINQLIASLQKLVTKANLILQQTGAVASNFSVATSRESSKAEMNSNAAVDQIRVNLEASQMAYHNATDQLLNAKEEISKTVAALTSLNLTSKGLRTMLPVLKQAVGAFTSLQAQFAQITQFFESLVSLLKDFIQPSTTSWIVALQNPTMLAGVSISDFTRQLIYTQMMVPLRVGILSQKVAATYLDVSTRYILPAQRNVGSMMQFSTDSSDAAKAALKANLDTAQQGLQKQTSDANTYIQNLIAADQKTFTDGVSKRLTDIQTALQPVLPEIAQPVPKEILDVMSAYVQQITEKRGEAADENPMFSISIDAE